MCFYFDFLPIALILSFLKKRTKQAHSLCDFTILYHDPGLGNTLAGLVTELEWKGFRGVLGFGNQRDRGWATFATLLFVLDLGIRQDARYRMGEDNCGI